jgi:hypothetical protein
VSAGRIDRARPTSRHAADTTPRAFTVSCINPGTQAGRGGFRVLQQHRTLQVSTLAVSTPSEQDAVSAQKLGQLHPFVAAFPQECMGQPASFGPT